MNIWAVANQKGGVGKTTTTVTLAGLLVQRGYRVLVLDLDPHGSLTSYFGFDPDAVEESIYTLFDMASRKSAVLAEDVLLQTDIERLDLLPAAPALATLDRQLGVMQGMGLVLKRALGSLSEQYDFAIMDCPPVLGVLMVNALAACERLLIPVQTDFLALKGLERMMRTLSMIMRARHTQVPCTIIPTMFDAEIWSCLESLQTLKQRYNGELWQAEVPVDSQFRDASRTGMPLPLVNPHSPGVSAYRLLLDETLLTGAMLDQQTA
ncbi:MAG TPA: ParA family protein [Acidiferrobacteraceae bacterium]|nr:ParA family protein [Acidiferrobacteraceae bacterium]